MALAAVELSSLEENGNTSVGCKASKIERLDEMGNGNGAEDGRIPSGIHIASGGFVGTNNNRGWSKQPHRVFLFRLVNSLQ